MHRDFVDWCQQISFFENRETLEMRWRAIEKIVDVISDEDIEELIRVYFGVTVSPEGYLKLFKESFRTEDSMFRYTGNDLEVAVMAGCVLALLCINRDNDNVSLLILTASAFNLRSSEVTTIDLVRIASDVILRDGVKERERSSLNKPKNVFFKKNIDSVLEQIDTMTASGQNSTKVLAESLFSTLKLFQTETNKNITNLQKRLEVQDEELQILWWMVGGYSDMWGFAFSDLPEKSRPILVAKEVSGLVGFFSEPPSIKSIFSHLGVPDCSSYSIFDVVSACEPQQLKKLTPAANVCPIIYPLHSAIYFAHENEDASWKEVWQRKSMIQADALVSACDLSMQFYHELQSLEAKEAFDG